MNPKFNCLPGPLKERVNKDWIDKLFPPESEVVPHSLNDPSTDIDSNSIPFPLLFTPYPHFSLSLSSSSPSPYFTYYYYYPLLSLKLRSYPEEQRILS